MPNRSYNPKQGWLLPYAIRPLPPERAAALAAAAMEVRSDDPPAGDPSGGEPQPA